MGNIVAKDKASTVACIDADSLAMLEGDVKKKKPRKFFMVYKGSQIKTLGVFKMGPFGPKIMQAKKAGHIGDILYGVVVGSGEKLTFMFPTTGEIAEAMKVDSWAEDPPVEITKFKKFMKENSFVCKPSFQAVTNLADVPNVESDEADGEVDTPPVAPPAPPSATAPPPEPPAANAADLFKQRLAGLVPQIKQAAGTAPGEQAKLKANEAAALAKQNRFADANQTLDEAEEALQAELASTDGAAPSTGPDLAQLWKDREEGLVTSIRQLEPAGVDLAKYPNITKCAKGARDFGKRGEYEKAHKVADEVDRLVAEALREARTSEASSAVSSGFVKKQVYLRERWRKVPFEVDARVNALRPHIGNDLTAAVNEALRNLIAEIDQQIQDSVDRGGRDFGPVIQQIDKAMQVVNGDVLIQHLDRHPTLSEVAVKSTFLGALDDLKTTLLA